MLQIRQARTALRGSSCILTLFLDFYGVETLLERNVRLTLY